MAKSDDSMAGLWQKAKCLHVPQPSFLCMPPGSQMQFQKNVRKWILKWIKDLFLPHGAMGLKYTSSWLRGEKNYISWVWKLLCKYVAQYSCAFVCLSEGYISRGEMLDQKIHIFHILVDTTESTSKITGIFFC